MTAFKVGYLIGSLSSTSINRKLAQALVKLAAPQLALTEITFRDLPPYSQDHDADYPPVARAFKEAIPKSDAILFVTPEYNRSIPGALKNAIDWASRPYGQNAFARKPSAVIGASPGPIGTAVGQQSLRAVLGFCNAPQMTSPEAYIQFTPGLVDDSGEVTVESTREFLRNYMEEFALFIQRVTTCCPARTDSDQMLVCSGGTLRYRPTRRRKAETGSTEDAYFARSSLWSCRKRAISALRRARSPAAWGVEARMKIAR